MRGPADGGPSMRRRVVPVKRALTVALVLGALGGLWWWRSASAAAATAAAARPPVVAATRGDLTLDVECTGRVVPERDIDITCKAGGEVLHVSVDVSDVVTKGALLLELDPRDEDRRFRQTEINVASSQARVDRARADLALADERLGFDVKTAETDLSSAREEAADAVSKEARVSALFKAKSVSQEEAETARLTARLKSLGVERALVKRQSLDAERRNLELKRADLRLAEAQLSSDQISLEIAKQRLQDIKVLAPSDGVVAARFVQPGQIIASAMENVGGGTKLFTLSDLSRLYVIASIDESDIGRVRMGQAASIKCDAFPETTFRGTVVRIATKGVSTSSVVTFEVTVEILGPERELLRPEMTASVAIRVAERHGVLTLPSDVVRRDAEGAYVIMAPKPGERRQRSAPEGEATAPGQGRRESRRKAVVTGLDDGAMVEIVEGVAEGDSVLGAGTGGGKFTRDPNARSQRMATGALMRGFGGGR